LKYCNTFSGFPLSIAIVANGDKLKNLATDFLKWRICENPHFFLRNISLNDIKRSVYQPVFGSLDSIDFHDVSDNAVINGACRLLQSSMLP